jgi:hypothetical protein
MNKIQMIHRQSSNFTTTRQPHALNRCTTHPTIVNTAKPAGHTLTRNPNTSLAKAAEFAQFKVAIEKLYFQITQAAYATFYFANYAAQTLTRH